MPAFFIPPEKAGSFSPSPSLAAPPVRFPWADAVPGTAMRSAGGKTDGRQRLPDVSIPAMTIRWMSKTVGYLPGPVNVGVVRLGRDEALVIDAGLDGDRGKKVIRALEAERLRPSVLFLTHSHADHFGGGALLAKRAGVLVAAPAEEAAFIRRPRLEPFALYGLAEPPPGLRTKFLQAPPLQVDLELEPGPWTLPSADPSLAHPATAEVREGGTADTVEAEIVDLGGHAPGQCGLLIEDILFAADAVFPPDIWAKHGFVYHASVGGALASIQTIAAAAPGLLIPGHGEPSDDVASLAAANREGIEKLSRAVAQRAEQTDEGASTEGVLAGLAKEWGYHFRGLPDYYLARACVQAHLSHLVERRRLTPVIEGGRLLWRRA